MTSALMNEMKEAKEEKESKVKALEVKIKK
jgi:hypothetical protein